MPRTVTTSRHPHHHYYPRRLPSHHPLPALPPPPKASRLALPTCLSARLRALIVVGLDALDWYEARKLSSMFPRVTSISRRNEQAVRRKVRVTDLHVSKQSLESCAKLSQLRSSIVPPCS